MNNSFDLTTNTGYSSASKVITFILGGPIAYLIWCALESDNTIEKQYKMAIKLIKAGKKFGLKELSIRLSRKAGLQIGFSVEGIPISIAAQSDNFMELIAKYE